MIRDVVELIDEAEKRHGGNSITLKNVTKLSHKKFRCHLLALTRTRDAPMHFVVFVILFVFVIVIVIANVTLFPMMYDMLGLT